MRMILFLSVVMTFLSGCATKKGYEKVLNTWIGKTETEMVEKMGPPNGTYQLPKQKVLTYSYSTIASTTIYSPQLATAATVSSESGCRTHFFIANDVVVKWLYFGSECKALEPRKTGAESLDLN